MNIIQHIVKRVITITLFLALCVSFFSIADAEVSTTRTVRVGYLLSRGYQEGGEGMYKTGFGYEYYQKLSYYNGWKYEYVYGGFSDLLEKLKLGEIDIMGNLSYTDERAQFIDFSDRAQGYEAYYLLTLATNQTIAEDDPSTLNGKKVGISKGSIQYRMFVQWCTENGANCEIIEYSDKAARESALNSGEIDATVTTRLMYADPNYNGWRAVMNVGSSDYYFGVSKRSDPGILQELNSAMEMVYLANPNYFRDTHEKFFRGRLLVSDFWTSQEKAWLTEHQYTARMGFLDDYLPLSNTDEHGNINGVIHDLAETARIGAGITLDRISFSSYDDMRNALLNGDLDVIFPAYDDYWAGEQQGIFLSNTVMEMPATLLYKGAYSALNIDRIAVSDETPFQKYLSIILYPEAELIQCETLEDTIRAVSGGSADGVIVASRIMQLNERFNISHNLSEVTLPRSVGIAFAVRSGNTALLSITDKCLDVFGSDNINQDAYKYSIIDRKYTFLDLVSDNPVDFLMISVLIILAILIGSALVLRNAKRRNNALLAAREAAENARLYAIKQESIAQNAQEAMENNRIRMMISQMRPHFMYNALSAIQTIIKIDPNYASDLILDFTTYLRSTVKVLSSGEPIPFSKELENIRAYLNIEKMRFGDRIHVIYQIDSDAFSILPLSIQPLAENAARHGLYPKTEEGGTIWIRSYKTNDAYVVEVEDDGEGFDKERVLASDSDSVGLKNLIYRLKSKMNADVDIQSTVGKGTLVRVTIPQTQHNSKAEGEA